jgi:hypothetical protein
LVHPPPAAVCLLGVPIDATQINIDRAKWFPDAVIPGLKPYGMETVPGFRLLPGMVMPPTWQPTPGEPNPYEDPQWRLDHKAYARRLRDEVRPEIHERGNRDPNFAHIERLKCADDPNYFGMVYGWIQDPQPLPDEEQDKPYAKFAYQCDNTTTQQQMLGLPRSRRMKLWRDKSRQLGISWDDEHFDTWFYLWLKGQIKIVSRSEKWVDNGSSVEAMMGKIKYILIKIGEHTPYLLPEGYSVTQLLSPPNYKHLNLINPVSGAAVFGEATTAKVARGGTYTYGRADEDGFIPNLDQTLTSMQGSCPRIFLASTATFEEGEAHFAGWQAAKEQEPDTVREYNWHQNAYLDLQWERDLLASAKTDAARQGVMREAFRDPFAGASNFVYPEARDIPDVNQPYIPEEPLDIIMDPAGAGDDFAFFAAQATALDGTPGCHILWSHQEQFPNPLRVAHIATGIWPERGDECWPWQPDTTQRQIGELLYALWVDDREVRWFSDPAGDQVHSKASFLTMFRDLTRELRTREYERLKAINIALDEAGKPPRPLPTPYPIAPKFKAIKQHRLFGDREYALRPLIPHITCQAGVPSARWVAECLRRTSNNELTKSAVTEPRRKHDQYSHHASNCENYALYFRYRFVDPLDTKGMRKLQRDLGLRPGPGKGAIPKGFGLNRNVGLPNPNRGLPSRVAPGGWR